jgi:hypothetical protein
MGFVHHRNEVHSKRVATPSTDSNAGVDGEGDPLDESEEQPSVERSRRVPLRLSSRRAEHQQRVVRYLEKEGTNCMQKGERYEYR